MQAPRDYATKLDTTQSNLSNFTENTAPMQAKWIKLFQCNPQKNFV